jgi:hypothetical protein
VRPSPGRARGGPEAPGLRRAARCRDRSVRLRSAGRVPGPGVAPGDAVPRPCPCRGRVGPAAFVGPDGPPHPGATHGGIRDPPVHRGCSRSSPRPSWTLTSPRTPVPLTAAYATHPFTVVVRAVPRAPGRGAVARCQGAARRDLLDQLHRTCSVAWRRDHAAAEVCGDPSGPPPSRIAGRSPPVEGPRPRGGLPGARAVADVRLRRVRREKPPRTGKTRRYGEWHSGAGPPGPRRSAGLVPDSRLGRTARPAPTDRPEAANTTAGRTPVRPQHRRAPHAPQPGGTGPGNHPPAGSGRRDGKGEVRRGPRRPWGRHSVRPT